MTTRNNSASGGSAGVVPSPANSGGASGDAWDTVTVVNTDIFGAPDPGRDLTLLTYDAGQGSMAYKIFSDTNFGFHQGLMSWNFPTSTYMGGQADIYRSFTGAFGVPIEIVRMATTGDPIDVTDATAVYVSGAGFGGPLDAVITFDTTAVTTPGAGGRLKVFGTVPVPTDSWFRVEWDIFYQVPGTTNTYEVRVYPNQTSSTAIETLQGTWESAVPSFFTTSEFGHFNLTQANTYWLDNLRARNVPMRPFYIRVDGAWVQIDGTGVSLANQRLHIREGGVWKPQNGANELKLRVGGAWGVATTFIG